MFGMKKRDVETLRKIMHQPDVVPACFLTVAEYIARYNPTTTRRTSKKGVELVKVFYPDGTAAEYEESRINDICSYRR